MVYEDESSNDYSILVYVGSSSDGMQYQAPSSIDDQDYMGVETTPLVSSEHHGLASERRVAFEGFDAGMRLWDCLTQASVIQNLKLKHLKEKEQPSEARKNLQVWVDELNKSREKLTHENSSLKLHMGDLKKGHEKLTAGRAELKLHIADLLR
ncbi:hypothetical protein D1007_37998 [Hordeum vulgare]|nr:hypothetical protein D1007_37998 [Hordeum vulgare]